MVIERLTPNLAWKYNEDQTKMGSLGFMQPDKVDLHSLETTKFLKEQMVYFEIFFHSLSPHYSGAIYVKKKQ